MIPLACFSRCRGCFGATIARYALCDCALVLTFTGDNFVVFFFFRITRNRGKRERKTDETTHAHNGKTERTEDEKKNNKLTEKIVSSWNHWIVKLLNLALSVFCCYVFFFVSWKIIFFMASSTKAWTSYTIFLTYTYTWIFQIIAQAVFCQVEKNSTLLMIMMHTLGFVLGLFCYFGNDEFMFIFFNFCTATIVLCCRIFDGD